MELTFDEDEQAGFERAKRSLLERLERRLGGDHGYHGDGDDLVGNAALALDWKWGHGDGELAHWRPEELSELLVDWAPRKLSTPPEDWPGLPKGVAALLELLDADGLLQAGSAPLARLLGVIDDLRPAYLEAMADPANWGMAKSLFASAPADLDRSDQVALQRFMDEFNARPEDERRKVIPDSALGPPRSAKPPALPPVVLPTEAAVDDSAAAAPIVAMFEALAAYVGGGRKLTSKGNLTLADARALVALLDTGDRLEEVFGDTTYGTRSSAELPRLSLVFRWAKKAGVVRIAHGKVLATKAGRDLYRNRRAGFDRALSALLDVGPLAIQRDADGWFAWPEVTEFLDDGLASLLLNPFIAQGPTPLDAVAEIAAEAVLDTFSFAGPDDTIAPRVGRDVAAIVDVLELAGVTRRADTTLDEWGTSRIGGTVELTPAGVATVHRLLGDAGYDAPTAGGFVELSAAELLALAEDHELGPEALSAELAAWAAARPPEEAARALADAAAANADDHPLRSMLALAALSDVAINLDIIEPLVRELAACRPLAGAVRCWLVDAGREEPASLLVAHPDAPDDLDAAVEALAFRFFTGGPEELTDALAAAGGHDAQIALLGRLWRVPSPVTGSVLDAIGGTHPVKAVAKAARKDALRHRSWMANR